jgi:hypothetical protein
MVFCLKLANYINNLTNLKMCMDCIKEVQDLIAFENKLHNKAYLYIMYDNVIVYNRITYLIMTLGF